MEMFCFKKMYLQLCSAYICTIFTGWGCLQVFLWPPVEEKEISRRWIKRKERVRKENNKQTDRRRKKHNYVKPPICTVLCRQLALIAGVPWWYSSKINKRDSITPPLYWLCSCPCLSLTPPLVWNLDNSFIHVTLLLSWITKRRAGWQPQNLCKCLGSYMRYLAETVSETSSNQMNSVYWKEEALHVLSDSRFNDAAQCRL